MKTIDVLKAIIAAFIVLGIALLALMLWSLSTTKRVETVYVDKCLFEVEGFENNKYPVYELHPWEDCEE